MSNRENLVYFNNQKTQQNPYTNTLEEYGVSGDVAGVVIQKLNSREFSEIAGSTNSDIKNIVSINQYTYDEALEKEKDNENIIERLGDKFFIHGNTTNKTDKEHMTAYLNIKLLVMYIDKGLSKYFDNMIGSNFSDKRILRRLEGKMEEISGNVKRYLRDFAYEITYEDDKRKIDVDIFQAYNKPIGKIKLNIQQID